MYCGRCGRYAGEQALFCPTCGSPLGPQPAAQPAWTSPPAPAAGPKNGRRLTVILTAVAGLIVLGGGVTAAVVLSNNTNGHATGAGSPTRSVRPSGATTSDVSARVVPSPSPTLDFATIYAEQQSGVVRIETLSCSSQGIGTGFLLSPTLIATVNHVIDQSVVVSLVDGDQRTTGTVIGSDPVRDLALIRAATPLTGHHFTFASSSPKIGDQVAAIGFPIGNPITLTHGDVSGLDRNITVEGNALAGMVETDAAINPGNSGGPLINQHGEVVGLVDALDTSANGIAYAVPSDQAAAAFSDWQQRPQTVAPAQCSNPLGPSQADANVPPPSSSDVDDAQAAGIAAAFNTYFDGINAGDYATAYDVLSPRLRAGSTEPSFAEGDATSYDFAQAVLAAHAVDPTTVRVALAFTSLQTADKGPDGDTCDDWTLVYTMIQGSGGNWLIDRTQPYKGVSHTPC